MVTIVNTALLAIVVALGAWNLNTTHEMTLKINSLEATVKQQTKNRWSSAHQKIWTGELKERNPTLNIPDPLEVSRTIEP